MRPGRLRESVAALDDLAAERARAVGLDEAGGQVAQGLVALVDAPGEGLGRVHVVGAEDRNRRQRRRKPKDSQQFHDKEW